MKREDIKKTIKSIEKDLPDQPFIIIHSFERNGRKLHLGLTEKLRKSCKDGRVWMSKEFFSALENAKYGFDEKHAISPGGSDGIFLLTRNYRPKNKMMAKIFDRFLDKAGSGAGKIAERLDSQLSSLIPVRLASHHMRILGVLKRNPDDDILILVDYDNTK